MTDPFVAAGFQPSIEGGGTPPPPPTPPAPGAGNEPPAPGTPPNPLDPLVQAGQAQFAPAGTPPAPPAPPAPSPEADFLKGILGGKFTKAEELNTYLSELETKVNSTPEDPFVNSYVKSLNEAIRNGIDPEVFAEVSSIDIDTLDAKEALVLQHMWQDKLSREEAVLLVDNKYRFGENENAEDTEVKLARINAKTDSNKAKEFLKTHQQEALTPPAEKLIAEQQKAWEPVYSQITEPLKTLKIEGKSGVFTLPVNAEVMQQAETLVREIISSGMFDVKPDKEGIEFARNVAYKEILANSLPAILDGVADYYRLEAIKQQHNPKPPGGQTPPPASEGSGIAEFLAQTRGVKLTGV